MRTAAAIILGKLISKVTRTLKMGGGTAAPGLYGLKLDPELVNRLTSRIPKNIVITGTNGKTTTSRILAHFAKASGLKVIRNHTGSNLERGIASALIANHHLLMSNDKSLIAIWELDEAAFNIVAPKLKPDVVVFLNVFRDQLDRYGEVNSVVKRWQETIKKLPKKTLILVNGDDANTAKLGGLKFGVKDYKIQGEAIQHLREKENLDFEAKNIKLNGLKGSSFMLANNQLLMSISLPLPGLYHIYDALAAIAAASLLGLPMSNVQRLMSSFQPAFGRVEKLPFGYIFLIKNPAGATQVFQTIALQIKKQDRLLLALNDNLADGTDVSWIWDAEWERIQTTGYRQQIICSGTRAADLAVRLKYAGFDPKQIIVEPDLKNAFKQARGGLQGKLFILPTYTAMLEIQRILAKIGVKKEYWNE